MSVFLRNLSTQVDIQCGGNWAKLSRMSVTPPQSLQKIKNGALPRIDTLQRISNALNISMDQLCADDEEIYRAAASAVADDDLVGIDHYPIAASAGFGAYPADHALADNKHWFSKKWISNKGLYAKDLSLIRVYGDSMEPLLRDKDLIMLDTSKTIPTAAMPFVVRVGDVLYVKLLSLLTKNPAPHERQ